MTDLAGLPDLGRPFPALPGSVYHAYDRVGHAVVLPSELSLARQEDGSAELLVTLMRRGQTTAGRIEAGFSIDAPLSAVGAAAVRSGLPLVLLTAEPLGGVLDATARFPSPESVLGPPQTLGAAGLTTARIVAELPSQSAVLAARLVREATVPVDARVRLVFRAVAPRVPAEVTVEPRSLLALLSHRFGPAAVVTFGQLAAALDEAVTEVPAHPDRAAALALRLRAAVSRREPGAEPLHRLREEAPSGTLTVDLAAPEAVEAELRLVLDPSAQGDVFTVGVPGRYIREVDAPGVPTGRTTVTFAANLPAPVAGLTALLADLRVPPSPVRPQEITASVALTAPAGLAAAQITLAPGERPVGEVRLRAVLEGTGELDGPWRPAGAGVLLLAPDAFPAPLVVVRATAALTALAVAEIRTAGGTVVGRVDAARPALAVPLTGADPPTGVTVRPLGPGRVVELTLDRRRMDLDPATLPGFGAHGARLRHVPAGDPLSVEWRAEGEDEARARTVRLSADRPQADIGWVATSPFRPGLVWRVPPGDWSEPVPPADRLVIDVDPAVDIDGIALRPDPGRPGTWTYLPPGPFLDGPDAVGLIEAGPLAFLQMTSRIDLPDVKRAALLAGLGRGAVEVRPTDVTVRRVALETGTPDGGWTVVAEGTSSGVPPWITALSAALTDEHRTAARDALDGTAGRMRLVAELIAGGRPVTRTRDIADLITSPDH